jgi:aldose 1-epimerase
MGEIKGKRQCQYRRYGALCFETQNYPEAVGYGHFPSPMLKKGQVYETATTFKFSTFD